MKQHQSEMEVLQTFSKNLLFFQRTQPELYAKIEALNSALEQGIYPPNYQLEYLNDSYFDVKEIQTGVYLYSSNSDELAKKSAKSVDHTKIKNVFETYYNFSFDKETADLALKADIAHHKLVALAPVVQYVEEQADKKKTTMKKIHKCIVLGVGLGLHLSEIHHKFGVKVYCIVENNLELFRLSMFVTDYESIASKSNLYFAVMLNRQEFRDLFQAFFMDSFIRNHYIKYVEFMPGYISYQKEIQNIIVSQPHLMYPFNRLIHKIDRSLERQREGYNFLNIQNKFNNQFLENKPILVIAPGPSVDPHKDWLKQNADKFLIITVFAAMPIFDKLSVKPDIVVHIDEREASIDRVLERVKNDMTFSDTVYVLSPSVNVHRFEKFVDKKNIFLLQDRTNYKIDCGTIQTASVGELAYAVALLTDVKNIYLLGIDLALDSVTGKTHSSTHHNENIISKENNIQDNGIDIMKSTLPVRGNFSDQVFTTPLFDASINVLNNLTKKYKSSKQKVYNLSNGAYFENTIPYLIDNVPISNYQVNVHDVKVQNLKDIFLCYSQCGITEEEEKLFIAIKERLLRQQALIHTFGTEKFVTLEKFYRAFVRLGTELVDINSDYGKDMLDVNLNYFSHIGSYIGDFENTKELNNPKRHIKKLQKIIAGQLEKILDKQMSIILKMLKK